MFITYIHAVKCTFGFQNRWSHNQSWWVYPSNTYSNATMRYHRLKVIAMLEMINQDEDMKISFKCSVAHQLLLKFTKSWTVFEQHCPQYELSVFIHWFIIWSSFFAPSWSKYCLFSFLGSAVLPQVVNFSRSVEKCWCHFCQGFLPIWSIFFGFGQSFLF